MKKYLLLCIIVAISLFALNSCCIFCGNSSKVVKAKIKLKEIYYTGQDIGKEWKFNFKICDKDFKRDDVELAFNNVTLLNWELFNEELIFKGDSTAIYFNIEENDPFENDKSSGRIILYLGEENEINIPVVEGTLIDELTISIFGISGRIPTGSKDKAILKLKFEIEKL